MPGSTFEAALGLEVERGKSSPAATAPCCPLDRTLKLLDVELGQERYTVSKLRVEDYEARTWTGVVGRGRDLPAALAALLDALIEHELTHRRLRPTHDQQTPGQTQNRYDELVDRLAGTRKNA